MAPARFEKYTSNKVGALNFSIVNMCPKILGTMSVIATAALGQSFLTQKKMLLLFFSIPTEILTVTYR